MDDEDKRGHLISEEDTGPDEFPAGMGDLHTIKND